MIGLPTDTAVAAASLIFGGVLKEFPRLRFCLAHGGGSCLALWGRWEHRWSTFGGGNRTAGPQFDVQIVEPPSTFLPLLYFDSLIHDAATLEFLVNSVGANRVMLGTDYPFPMGDYRSVEKIDALPDVVDGGKELIWGGTAAELFKI